MCAKLFAWGIALFISPHPGRIQEEFCVELPRPHDLNTADALNMRARIMRSLHGSPNQKKLLPNQTNTLFAFLFFSLLLFVY